MLIEGAFTLADDESASEWYGYINSGNLRELSYSEMLV